MHRATRQFEWGLAGAWGLLFAMAACGPFQFQEWEGGTTSGGGSAGFGGAGGSGAGGSDQGGGGSGECMRGAERDCSTEKAGECEAGKQRCLDTGAWEACAGAAEPQPETTDPERDVDCGGTALIDAGLLVRYYINEAASETAPAHLLDATPEPVNLALNYGNGNLSFTEIAGHKALSWSTIDDQGMASASLVGTKIRSALGGATRLTLEVVTNVETTSNNSPRLVALGFNDGLQQFNLYIRNGPSRLRLVMNEQEANTWPLSTPSGRVVLHLVMDTAQPSAADRWRLYRDGQLVPGALPGSPLPEGTTLDLSKPSSLVLGNQLAGSRSFRGKLYYVALYSIAFEAAQVAVNAALLTDNDDDWSLPRETQALVPPSPR
ncbi:LamG-like jellyroll fold domain-containing protein [Chondromyces crocatus]|nr:LamG-like jellyroll fold domain-containing protein [Chondromyces crocatus]